jgi:hypothetical protein
MKKLQKSKIKNVHLNETKTEYIVKSPDGKTKTYKTLRGAEARARLVQSNVSIPSIVTANTYFWSSSVSASSRRRNEDRRQTIIDEFCARVNAVPGVEASGSYAESCRNVYKLMSYTINGRNTNLTGLIGECARWGLNLVK